MNKNVNKSRNTLKGNGSIIGNAIGSIGSEIRIKYSPSQYNLDEDFHKLLTQLQEVIESEPNLSEENKTEALEQITIMAEAGSNSGDGTLKKAARTAMKILKGTAASLPAAAKLVEESNKLLPAIGNLLRLG